MSVMKKSKNWDTAKKNQAELRAGFRGVVCGYLLYLAIKTIEGVYGGNTTMPVWTGWLLGLLLAAAAVVFGTYAWKQYQAALKDAELPEEDAPPEDDAR